MARRKTWPEDEIARAHRCPSRAMYTHAGTLTRTEHTTSDIYDVTSTTKRPIDYSQTGIIYNNK